jgi:hypothetical protein
VHSLFWLLVDEQALLSYCPVTHVALHVRHSLLVVVVHGTNWYSPDEHADLH